MTTQTDIFDAKESQARKEEGMAVGAMNRAEVLHLARCVAVEIARAGDGTCHADQVGRVLKRRYGINSLGAAAGSIFKGGDWEFTGEFVKLARKTNHSRLLRVWRLK